MQKNWKRKNRWITKYYKEYEWEKASRYTYQFRIYSKYITKEEAIKPAESTLKRKEAEKIWIHNTLTMKIISKRVRKWWSLEQACKTPRLWHWGSRKRCVL